MIMNVLLIEHTIAVVAMAWRLLSRQRSRDVYILRDHEKCKQLDKRTGHSHAD